MTKEQQGARSLVAPEAQLENALIDEFLRSRNLDSRALHALAGDELKRVMTEATAYASAKLAEVESRAHFVHEIHSKE
jgi:hypothetical protein